MAKRNFYERGIVVDAYVYSADRQTKLTLRDYFLRCLFAASRNHTTFDNSVVDFVVTSICDLAKTAMLSQLSSPEGADFDDDLTYASDDASLSGSSLDVTAASDARIVSDKQTSMDLLFFVRNEREKHANSDSSDIGFRLYDAIDEWFGTADKMILADWLRHMALWDISIYKYPFASAVDKQVDEAVKKNDRVFGSVFFFFA